MRSQNHGKEALAGVTLWALNRGAVAATLGKQLSGFASYDDYMLGRSTLTIEAEFDLAANEALIGGDARRVLLARQPGDNEIESGFHRIGVVNADKPQWMTISTLGTTVAAVRAIGLVGNYAAFVFQSIEIVSEQRAQLWLCPFAELAAVGRAEIACDVYFAPDDLEFSIGVANNDLESLGIRVMSFEYCDGLIGVRRSGWVWLVDPKRMRQDAVPGTGLVSCTMDHSRALVYRARRIDEVKLSLSDAHPTKASMTIVRASPVQ